MRVALRPHVMTESLAASLIFSVSVPKSVGGPMGAHEVFGEKTPKPPVDCWPDTREAHSKPPAGRGPERGWSPLGVKPEIPQSPARQPPRPTDRGGTSGSTDASVQQKLARVRQPR